MGDFHAQPDSTNYPHYRFFQLSRGIGNSRDVRIQRHFVMKRVTILPTDIENPLVLLRDILIAAILWVALEPASDILLYPSTNPSMSPWYLWRSTKLLKHNTGSTLSEVNLPGDINRCLWGVAASATASWPIMMKWLMIQKPISGEFSCL